MYKLATTCGVMYQQTQGSPSVHIRCIRELGEIDQSLGRSAYLDSCVRQKVRHRHRERKKENVRTGRQAHKCLCTHLSVWSVCLSVWFSAMEKDIKRVFNNKKIGSRAQKEDTQSNARGV